MKKLIMSVFVVFVFGVISTPALSKAKKNSTRKKPNFTRLQYEPIWFSRLSEKKQRVYLNTMAKLVKQMSRGGVAFVDDPFMELLMPYLDAAPRINNGFSFEGANDGADFDRFLAEINVVNTDINNPGCTGNNQVCSPLMGMTGCSGSNPGQLACSPDSTATCASRGSIACLHQSLESCGLDRRGNGTAATSAYCQTLDRVYRRASQGVRETCASGQFSTACAAALRQLDAANVTPEEHPTPNTPAPTGADCEQMIAELESARDRRTPDPIGENPESRNNAFWRDLRGFAQQSCGTTVAAASSMMGLCTVPDMIGADGVLDNYRSQTLNRGDEGYTACVDTRIAGFQSELDAAIERVNNDPNLSREGRRAQIATLTETFNNRKAEAERTECHTSSSEGITDARANTVTEEYPIRQIMGLASKLRSNTRLSDSEENQLRAATGLTSAQFREVFCSGRNHDDFMVGLRQQIGAGEVTVNGTSPESNLYLGQARVARVKMQRCAANARANNGEISGCDLTQVSDARSLRCATPEHPILALNRRTNRCMLVTGLVATPGTTVDVPNIDGTTTTRVSEATRTLSIRTPGSSTTMTIANETQFINDYQMQEYRCDGERSVAVDTAGIACWRATEVDQRYNPNGIEAEIVQ